MPGELTADVINLELGGDFFRLFSKTFIFIISIKLLESNLTLWYK